MKSQPYMDNLAYRKPVRASSFQNPYIPEKAVDGAISEASRWLSSELGEGPHWLEVDLGEPLLIGSAYVYTSARYCYTNNWNYELQIQNGTGEWQAIPGTRMTDYRVDSCWLRFEPVTASKVRFYCYNEAACLSELQLYAPGKAAVAPSFIHGVELNHVSKIDDYVRGGRVVLTQYGFQPEQPKKVFYQFSGIDPGETFAVKRSEDHCTAFEGPLAMVTDDFGTVQVGDFSVFAEEGEYYVEIGGYRSFGTFRIREHLWNDLQMLSAMHYFGLRRIGEDSIIGNFGDLLAVRWDDGRFPDGTYRYMGKSFGDGDDLRRYANTSLIVAQYCLLKQMDPFWDKADWIYDQVRWGLDGVLTFLGKDGLLEVTLQAHADGFRHTDGIFGSGDEVLLADPFDLIGGSNEYDVLNKEVIYTSLLIGPAEACLTFYDKDPVFFERVKQLVLRGYERIDSLFRPFPKKYSLSAWVWLNVLVFELTKDERYKQRAIREADRFMELQVTEALGDGAVSAKGWYRYTGEPDEDPWIGYRGRYAKFTDLDSAFRNPWGEKPEQEILIVPWIYQGMFRLIERFPDEPGKQRWIQSVESYCRDYLLPISKQNVYGLTPMKAGSKGLIRQKGTLSYQYFGEIGRSFHQLANGAFLLKTGKLLDDREMIDAAWEQMFYVTGANPVGIGLIYGVSSNIPSQQYSSETYGRAFPGGANNGFMCLSSVNDYPSFLYFEYYGYANLAALWFASEIPADRFTRPIELWPKELEEAPHASNDPGHPLIRFPLRMKGGFTYRFAALLRDEPDGVICWYVNGIPGGSEATGYVDEQGAYTAPFVTSVTPFVIRAESVSNPELYEETGLTVMPVPARVTGLRTEPLEKGIRLSWNPPEPRVNISGYTIWRRQPVTASEAGTIFERVGYTDADTVTCDYPETEPAGTEFLVKAYHRSEHAIYGFGLESNAVIL